jgi:hypothetical protein
VRRGSLTVTGTRHDTPRTLIKRFRGAWIIGLAGIVALASGSLVTRGLAASEPTTVTVQLAVGRHPIVLDGVVVERLTRSRVARESLVRRLGSPTCTADTIEWPRWGARLLLYLPGSSWPKLGGCAFGFPLALELDSPQLVIRTEFGRVRFGDRWADVAPALRKRAERLAQEDNASGRAWAWGRTDPCSGRKILRPSKHWPVMIVWLTGNGRVNAVKMQTGPFEIGTMCEPRG